MFKKNLLIALGAALFATVVTAEIDLSDFDDDLMRDMDLANKELEPLITAKNAEAAVESATVIHEGLKWTESYFAAKGGAEDAVKYAREGQALTGKVLEQLNAANLDAAVGTARELSKSCKTCHDAYKPLTP